MRVLTRNYGDIYIYMARYQPLIIVSDSVETVAKHDWIMVQPNHADFAAAMSVSKAHGYESHCKPLQALQTLWFSDVC